MVSKPVDRIHRKLSGISQPASGLFAHARELYQGLPSIRQSPTSNWELSEDEYRRELARLKLLRECFTHEEYRLALQEFLGWEIRKERLNDLQYPTVRQKIARRGIQAGMVPDPKHEVIWVIMPRSLKPWFEASYCLHEYGHTAGYHPVTYDRTMDKEYAASRELWYPPRQLPQRKPPITAGWSAEAADQWRETDADLREALGMKFGLLGGSYWNRDEVFLGFRS